MWSEEDEFGDVQIEEKIKREALRIPRLSALSYAEKVDQLAEEDAVSEEEKIRRRIAINRPMRVPPGAPDNWLCNARTKHGDYTWTDVHGKAKSSRCHCQQCILSDNPELTIGLPISVSDMTADELVKRGFVGIYRPPPPYSKPCPICGIVINLHVDIDEKSEVVHVRCLGEEERELLRNVGYSDPHMIRRKKDDADRGVDGEAPDHKCSECRCAQQSGKPVQDHGGEGSPLAEEGGEAVGTGERSEQHGVDVPAEQAGGGTEAGSRQADAGEEAADAEEDSG